MTRIAVLISGSGTNLQAIIDAIAALVFSIHITGAHWSSLAALAGGFVMKHFGEALEEE